MPTDITDFEAAEKPTRAHSLSRTGFDNENELVDNVVEEEGDLLTTPAGSLLLHSCNCMAAWGAGVAGALRQKFPRAYHIYEQHCNKHGWLELLGTTLLIPPQNADIKLGGRHWIGCLFTKIEPGRPSKPFAQLDLYDATKMALEDLSAQIGNLPADTFAAGIFCPLLNAGIFRVPWTITRRQLRQSGIPMTALTLPGDKSGTSSPEETREFVNQVKAQREEARNQGMLQWAGIA